MTNNISSIIIRHLKKTFSGTILAIAGLAIGLASVIIIFSYVNYEFSFDKQMGDYRNTYRFTTDLIWQNGDRQVTAVSPTPSAKYLVKDYPQITNATCFFTAPKTLLTLKDEASEKNFFEENLIFSDEYFPEIFNVKMLNDDVSKILLEPNSLIVSESTGKKLFGESNPVGKTIRMEGTGSWTIKGVMQDYPSNSHIRFNMLASIVGQKQFSTDEWRTMSAYTYFKVLPETKIVELEKSFENLIDKYLPIYKNMVEFRLQPLKNIHLKNDRTYDFAITSSLKNIYILLSISILILIISCFNYSNLLSTQNTKHQKEMGVKKILGASKASIFAQLFGKGILIALASVLVGIILTEISRPVLNQLFHYNIKIAFQDYILYSAIILFATGIISVVFPALSLTRISPVNLLQHFKNTGDIGEKITSQKFSLIVQFSLTIAIISGAIFSYKQMLFIKNRALGFSKENVMVLEIGNDESYKIPKLLKEELLKYPGVVNIGLCNSIPGNETSSEHFIPEGFENHLPLNIYTVDANFVSTLELQIIAGRNFNPQSKQDTACCLINEKTLKKLGWSKEEAIGKTMKWNFAQNREDLINGKVIGVVKDFHFRSLHQPVEELVITSHSKTTPVMLIKLLPDQLLTSVRYIESKFTEINPGVPFEYTFLKTNINQLYSKDDELRMLSAFFSAIAILISCLGLYSYSIAICSKKIKEIGIRKVNGAKGFEVLVMLNKEFVKWVAIAFVIATPIAYYAMNKWLENFAYKTELSWWIFALAGLLALGIALLTVSWQSWKAATKNPVEALRYE